MKRTALKPRKTPIRKVSLKRAKQNREYTKLRHDFLIDSKVCAVCPPGSYTHCTEVHHSWGRGKYFLHVPSWIPVCRNCHRWIHEHPSQARERGYLLT